MDRPRYMNVPLPAPCHINVAGVGMQSVWGLRIIARDQLLLWHDSADSSIPESGSNFRLVTKHPAGSGIPNLRRRERLHAKQPFGRETRQCEKVNIFLVWVLRS